MRTILLIMLTCWIHFGKTQDIKCFTLPEQKRLLKTISERDSLVKIVVILENNELICADQLESIRLQSESYKRTIDLYESESDARGKEIIKAHLKNKELEEKTVKQDRKIRRLKRQRLVFGGIGLALGLILPIIL